MGLPPRPSHRAPAVWCYAVAILKSLIIFEHGAPHLGFVSGSIDYVASSDERHCTQCFTKMISQWNFPVSPVVKNSCFYCRGMDLIPGLGTQILHVLRCSKKKQKTKKQKKNHPQCSNEGVVLQIKKLQLNELKRIGKGHLNSSLSASSTQVLAHCAI